MIQRFFTVNALFPQQGEDELNGFCGSVRVVSIEKQFVAAGEQSFWSVCVTYAGGQAVTGGSTNRPKVDYRELLNDKDFALYAQLRSLRKELAEAAGIPAYGVFNNEQLAEMVRKRVDSLAMLEKIEGIGKAKVEKYGAGFIEALQRALAKQQSIP
ncbi:MAG: HRDC domain-containing protein [Sedimenticola sp.]